MVGFRQVEHVVYPALRGMLRPSTGLAAQSVMVEVADLHELYKVRYSHTLAPPRLGSHAHAWRRLMLPAPSFAYGRSCLSMQNRNRQT